MTTATQTSPAAPVRPRDTIEVMIPDAPTRSSVSSSLSRGYPAHVDAYLLSDTIDLLQALVLTINPFDHDAEDYPATYRLRATIRRFTALLEEALAAHDELGYGVQCRTEVAELDERDARQAAPEARENKRGQGTTVAAPAASAATRAS